MPSGDRPQPEHPAHQLSLTKTKAKPVLPVVKPASKAFQKNLTTRSSKPIINWFQRKLAGSGRNKRNENHRSESIALARGIRPSTSQRATSRTASSPLPSSGTKPRANHDPLGTATQRKTISLNEDDDPHRSSLEEEEGDNNSLDESSIARDSTWSPGSALEADDDASLRPIPPSAPPSPSPSRSSSSYLSDPRTFKSIAASTKPTTLLSIDLNGGMAHIAQAAPTTTSSTYMNRFPPHIRTSSSTNNSNNYGNSAPVTFASLPQSLSRPSSSSNPPPPQATAAHGSNTITSVQAPLHTTHHPRNNPRPSSPPLDNASMLTLASSAYAIPGLRTNLGHSTSPSARGIGDSISHFGGSITYPDAESTSQFVLGDDERLEERDVDASVRALRPRSSRRGSWESEASRWSARVQLGAGTSLLARERSLRTTNSIKTGAFSTENPEPYDSGTGFEQTKDEGSQLDNSSVTDVYIETPSPAAEVEEDDLAPGIGVDISTGPEVVRKSTDTVEPPTHIVQEPSESAAEVGLVNSAERHLISDAGVKTL